MCKSETRKSQLTRCLITALLLSLPVVGLITYNVRADNATILPQDVHVATRTGLSSGSKLCWDWLSDLPLQFTVVRSGESATPLYEKIGSSDSGQLVIQQDDTYLLLWRNSGNTSVPLEFTVTVEPGSGSLLLLVIVVFVIIVLLVLTMLLSRKRRTSSGGLGRGSIEPPGTEVHRDARHDEVSKPTLPVETTPSIRGTTYCPICRSPVPRDYTICNNCGSRRGPQ